MRAYAFEWDTPTPPWGAAAVVVAGNVATARLVLAKYLIRNGYEERLAMEALSTKPGPYWTLKANRSARL
jgi:hypothetical protein